MRVACVCVWCGSGALERRSPVYEQGGGEVWCRRPPARRAGCAALVDMCLPGGVAWRCGAAQLGMLRGNLRVERKGAGAAVC